MQPNHVVFDYGDANVIQIGGPSGLDTDGLRDRHGNVRSDFSTSLTSLKDSAGANITGLALPIAGAAVPGKPGQAQVVVPWATGFVQGARGYNGVVRATFIGGLDSGLGKDLEFTLSVR